MTVTKYRTNTGAQYWKVEIVVNSIRARQQGFQTRREAASWETKEKTRLAQGGVKINRQITLGDYLDWWHGSFVQENPDDGVVWCGRDQVEHTATTTT